MINGIRNIVIATTVVLCLAGCGNGDGTRHDSVSGSGKAAGKKKPARKVIAYPVFEGTVAEVTNASNYTYIRMSAGGEERWVALPETDVAVGKKISVYEGSPMMNHHSPALGRTFEKIYFSPGRSDVAPKVAENPCALAGGKGQGKGVPAGNPATTTAPGVTMGNVVTGRVAEVVKVPGYTYVLVADGSNRVWAAAPEFAVAQGDTVSVELVMAMRNFKSSTLKRTFDVLYMVEKIPVLGKKGGSSD